MSTTFRLSKLDQLYRSICLTKFFIKGWGEPEKLRQCVEFRSKFLSRESCANLITRDYPIVIEKDQVVGKTRIIDGHFLSPLALHLPEIVEPPVDRAYFQCVLPRQWPQNSTFGRSKPMVVQLAGTGDHNFWRRRWLMADPLAKEHGIGSILLENPFYGLRKPKEQKRSSLRNVMDLFTMGGCLVLECLVLLNWCEQQGYGPLALHGISMGGHMASLAAGSYSKPVALIPCLSWSTASSAFTRGVMSNSVPWSLLGQQTPLYRGLTPLFDIPESKDVSQINYDISRTALGNRPLVTTQSDSKTVSIVVPSPASMANISKLQGFLNAFGWPLLYLKDHHLMLGSGSENAVARAAVEERVRRVMDEFTHLAHFPKPVDQTLIIAVAANRDAYLPRDGVTSLTEIWPEAEIRYIDRGHISAFLLDQSRFRKAIVDALLRMATKYGYH